MAQAVVVVRGDGRGGYLVAYVVPAAGAVVDERAVRESAAAVLPAYMVPAVVVVLDGAAADGERQTRPQGPARTGLRHARRIPWRRRSPIEEIVADVFADVLGVTGSA